MLIIVVKITTAKTSKTKYQWGAKNNGKKSGKLYFCIVSTTKYLVGLTPWVSVHSSAE